MERKATSTKQLRSSPHNEGEATKGNYSEPTDGRGGSRMKTANLFCQIGKKRTASRETIKQRDIKREKRRYAEEIRKETHEISRHTLSQRFSETSGNKGVGGFPLMGNGRHSETSQPNLPSGVRYGLKGDLRSEGGVPLHRKGSVQAWGDG